MRKYARPAAPPSWEEDAPGIEVRRLQPGETEWASYLIAEVLGLPDLAIFLFCDLPMLAGWRFYSAHLHGSEVACGTMLIHGGVALLAFDATAPDARGNGCNRALLRQRLLAAAEAGCETVFAEGLEERRGEGSAACQNLRAAGLQEIARSVVWRRPVGVRAQ